MLPDMEFNIIPSEQNYADIELSVDSTVRIDFDIGVEMGQSGRLPDYTGAYVVTPKLVEQVLPTKNKSMTDDVTVNEVPVDRVENLGHGTTVVICSE